MKEEIHFKYAYHNFEHIADVYSAAERIAKQEGVSEKETNLLLIAVLFHDAGFMLNSEDHEVLSCKIALDNLPDFEFTQEEIVAVLALIMATKIPQNPQNLLEKIICDADLDYLGRSDFWEIGDRLFDELETTGKVSNKWEWNNWQQIFLEDHVYFTRSNQILRNEKKHQNLEEVKIKLLNPDLI